MCYSSTTSDEVSACMGCRSGERRLGKHFSVCLMFIFLLGWEYHVSDAISVEEGGCIPSEVSSAPSEVSCPYSEVFVFWFWIGAGMSPGVLDSVIH